MIRTVLPGIACIVAAAGLAAAQTAPPPGAWTVIVHGRTGSCSYPSNYNDLTADTGSGNWMRQLASRIESLSPGAVNVYKMDASTLALTTVNTAAGGTNPQDPAKHHVLMFDWAATSDYDSILCASPGSGDRNGFAFAAGDSLYALLRNYNAAASVFGLIGFSRGAVVVSEASRRLMVEGTDPAQVIFLDGEGCWASGGTACNLYTDGSFDAWAPPAGTVRFDNLYETVNEHYLAPSVCNTDLGGHAKARCNTLNLAGAFAHTGWSLSSSCLPSYSQHSITEYLITSLQVSNGRYVFAAATGPITDPNPPAAGSQPITVPFNGDQAFASLAGWTGNGGSGGGTVSSLGGQSTLHLSRGQSQVHNYFAMPACPSTLSFDAAIDSTATGDSSLSIVLQASGLSDQEVGPIPLSQLSTSFGQPNQVAVPGAFAGRVSRLRFAVNGTSGTAAVHLASISFSACASYCYANCDASTVPPLLNANDFQCFLNRYAAMDPYANCDGSTVPPVLNANDFQCFLNAYAAGCS